MSQDVYGRRALGTIGQYQVSGEPFLTGSAISGSQEHLITFPNITKHVKLQIYGGMPGNELRLHLNSTSSAGGANIINNRHYYVITPSASFEGDLRCKELYVTVRVQNTPLNFIEYACFAGITQITASELYAYTGSGKTD